MVGGRGVILYGNLRAGGLFGYAQGELPGLRLEELVTQRGAGGADWLARRKDGSCFHAELKLGPLEDEDDGVRVAFIRDISAQRVLEEERARAVDRVERLDSLAAALSAAVDVDTVAAVILSTGLDAVRTHSSLLMRVVEGGRELEVLGEVGGGPDFVSQGAALVRASGSSAPMVGGRQRCPLDARFPHGDAIRERSALWLHDPGEILARFPALAPIYSQGGCRALACLPLLSRGEAIGALRLAFSQPRAFEFEEQVFLTSLAQQCALALDRAQLYEEALAARDLAERSANVRDEVMSIVAHDLGNPMSVIALWAQLILDDAVGETERLGATKIKGAVEKVSRLLHDLGDTSSLDAGHLGIRKQQGDLEAIVAETVATLGPLCVQKQLTLTGKAPPLQLWCDPGRLQQVLGNLVANAIKFTPEHGHITVEAGADEREVRFSVADTGPGISEEGRAHVFERYWRGRDAPEGVGLGLFISRGIVDAHGGRIWVESPASGGSLFCFTIPRAQA